MKLVMVHCSHPARYICQRRKGKPMPAANHVNLSKQCLEIKQRVVDSLAHSNQTTFKVGICSFPA